MTLKYLTEDTIKDLYSTNQTAYLTRDLALDFVEDYLEVNNLTEDDLIKIGFEIDNDQVIVPSGTALQIEDLEGPGGGNPIIAFELRGKTVREDVAIDRGSKSIQVEV